LDRIVAQLELAYQESRQRLKQAAQEAGAATPVKNETQSTNSPSVINLPLAVVENKSLLLLDSAGNTPTSNVKGIKLHFVHIFNASSSSPQNKKIYIVRFIKK